MNVATCEALLGHSVRFVVLLVKDLTLNDEEKQYDYEDCLDRIRKDHREQLRNGSLVVCLDEAFNFHIPRFKNGAHKLAVLTPWNQGLETVEDGGIAPSRPIGMEGGCNPSSSKPNVARQECVATGSESSKKVSEGGCTPSQRRHILINLDADNILAESFAERFAEATQPANVMDHINLPWEVM